MGGSTAVTQLRLDLQVPGLQLIRLVTIRLLKVCVEVDNIVIDLNVLAPQVLLIDMRSDLVFDSQQAWTSELHGHRMAHQLGGDHAWLGSSIG